MAIQIGKKTEKKTDLIAAYFLGTCTIYSYTMWTLSTYIYSIVCHTKSILGAATQCLSKLIAIVNDEQGKQF